MNNNNNNEELKRWNIFWEKVNNSQFKKTIEILIYIDQGID